MAILKVARLGHPILRKEALPVTSKELKSNEIQSLIDSMIETMHEYEGVGLAAPQVHVSKRICVVEFNEENPRYKINGKSGLHVFINPEIKALTKKTDSNWEGCLSVPGMRGLVARPNHIRVKYLDRTGASHEFEAKDFLAVVIQHEFDHLDGYLYVDRLVDTRQFAFDQEFERYLLPRAEEEVLD